MPAALLDTNAVSDLMRDHPRVKARVANHPDPILTSGRGRRNPIWAEPLAGR